MGRQSITGVPTGGAPKRESQGSGGSFEVSNNSTITRKTSKADTFKMVSKEADIGHRLSVEDVMENSDHVDIDEDVYGAAIFSITYDFWEMFSGKDHDGLGITLNIYRLCFVLFLLLCNYALQLGMLTWVYKYVALPQVHEAQSTYRKFHDEIFEHGEDGQVVWSDKRWEDWDEADQLCNIAFSNFWFMYAILCLWWILMLTEVRKTERMWRRFRQLRSTTCADSMIVKLRPHDPEAGGEEDEPAEGEEPAGEDLNLIVKLTNPTRATLYLALLLPKLTIAVVLTFVGTAWLTASTRFSDLILNSVALEFIICIDEILFEGLLPESIRQNIAGTKLVIPQAPKTGDHMKDAMAMEKKITWGYHRSAICTIGIIGGVYLFMTYGQSIPILGVFPGFQNDAQCPIWWREHTEQICKPGVECFPINIHKQLGN